MENCRLSEEMMDPHLRRPGFRPADIVTVLFIILCTCLIIACFQAVPHAWQFVISNFLILLYIITLSRYPILTASRWKVFLRLWYPVIVIPLIFVELREIIPAVNPYDCDQVLIQIDQILFGCQPSVLLQKIHHPLLTEVLQYIYSSFYFLPLFLGVVLVVKKRFELYDFYYFLICYGFFLSYLGYFFGPAIGPRFTIPHLYAFPLHGTWLFQDIVDLTNKLEALHRDCYPSGHTMMTLLTIHFSFFHTKKLFYVYFPIGIFLIFSTLYLRYHYGIDVLAGAIFYLFVVFTARPLYRFLLRISKRFQSIS